MKSAEQMSLPEKKQEDPLARLRKIMEKQETPKEKEPEVKSMTVGKLEELQKLLITIDPDTFLNRKTGKYWSEEELKAAHDLLKEVISVREKLDSNTKKKLYRHIEERWKAKSEEAFSRLEKEVRYLELGVKKRELGYLLLSSEEINQLNELDSLGLGRKSRNQLLEELNKGIATLREFGIDEQKLKALEERFRKTRNAFKKALPKREI